METHFSDYIHDIFTKNIEMSICTGKMTHPSGRKTSPCQFLRVSLHCQLGSSPANPHAILCCIMIFPMVKKDVYGHGDPQSNPKKNAWNRNMFWIAELHSGCNHQLFPGLTQVDDVNSLHGAAKDVALEHLERATGDQCYIHPIWNTAWLYKNGFPSHALSSSPIYRIMYLLNCEPHVGTIFCWDHLGLYLYTYMAIGYLYWWPLLIFGLYLPILMAITDIWIVVT